MIKLIGLWLVVCALCVTPVAADEGVYDGPTPIKPLTVTPLPQHSAPPNTVCDFEHQCYPEKGGPAVPAPLAPPVVAAKPAAPRPTVPDDPLVAAWRDCVGQALQNYEQSHNIHALQVATGSCQVRLEAQGDENFAGVEPPMPLAAPAGRVDDATSVAAGGPSAAMPTATVRPGVAASDDRKRDATQPEASRPRLATTAKRRLRPPATQRRCDGVHWEKHTIGSWAPERQHEPPGGPEFKSVRSG